MKFYNGRPAVLERDFHRLKISASHEIKKCIQALLKNLNIPESKWNKFDPELTIYDFLLRLARKGHPQVDYLIDLIDTKSKFNKREWALGGTILVSLSLYLLTQPAFQFVIDGIKTLFSSIIGLPVLSLIYNIGLFIYYFYDTYTNKKKNEFNRIRDNFFLSLSSLANVIAYITLIATSAVMSPAIAGLYIAAAIIDLLREVFCLAQEYFEYLNSPPIDENDHLSVHRAYARRVFGFEKRRNALGINLAAALIIVAITALWCFLPGGMAVTIVALSAIGVVYLAKHAVLKRNEEHLREHLQEQLQELDDQYNGPEANSEDYLDDIFRFESSPYVKQQPLEYSSSSRQTRKPCDSSLAEKLPFFAAQKENRRTGKEKHITYSPVDDQYSENRFT